MPNSKSPKAKTGSESSTATAQPPFKSISPSPSPSRCPEAAPAPAPAAPQQTGTPLTSPMVGTFYRAPSPGADPFVKVGDTVKKGQVVCIIEAMKLLNEVEADMDGTVKEVCVENGQPVEFGQSLFIIE